MLLEDIHLDYKFSAAAQASRFAIASVQVDNQLLTTGHPVVLGPTHQPPPANPLVRAWHDVGVRVEHVYHDPCTKLHPPTLWLVWFMMRGLGLRVQDVCHDVGLLCVRPPCGAGAHASAAPGQLPGACVA